VSAIGPPSRCVLSCGADRGCPATDDATDLVTADTAGVPYNWRMTEATEDAREANGELDIERGDGPEDHGDDVVTRALEVVEAWSAQLSDRVSVPASDVQDHLLDLWGALDEGPARAAVERWLTETLRRNLYSVSDINERLETLLPAN
jgi:hypothetical protein